MKKEAEEEGLKDLQQVCGERSFQLTCNKLHIWILEKKESRENYHTIILWIGLFFRS